MKKYFIEFSNKKILLMKTSNVLQKLNGIDEQLGLSFSRHVIDSQVDPLKLGKP